MSEERERRGTQGQGPRQHLHKQTCCVTVTAAGPRYDSAACALVPTTEVTGSDAGAGRLEARSLPSDPDPAPDHTHHTKYPMVPHAVSCHVLHSRFLDGCSGAVTSAFTGDCAGSRDFLFACPAGSTAHNPTNRVTGVGNHHTTRNAEGQQSGCVQRPPATACAYILST